EGLLIDTLEATARDAGNTGRNILTTLAGHARRHGTDAGRAALSAVVSLRAPVRAAATRGLRMGAKLGRAAGADLAAVASGILAGVADTLAPPEHRSGKAGPR